MSNLPDIYILSIESSGVKGFFQLSFLQHLAKWFNKPLNTIFSLTSGSSMGSFLAVMVSENTLDECLTKHKMKIMCNNTIWDNMLGLVQLQPKYDGKGKTRVLKDEIKINISETKLPVVIPTYCLSSNSLEVFSSITSKEDLSSIIDASSAVPLYFPPVRMNNKLYVDGGVAVNNPSSIALLTAKKLFPNRNIKILCVGSGKKSFKDYSKDDPEDFGLHKWISINLIDVFIEANKDVVDNVVSHYLGDRYLKIDSNDIGDILVDDDRAIERLIKEGEIAFNRELEQLTKFFSSVNTI